MTADLQLGLQLRLLASILVTVTVAYSTFKCHAGLRLDSMKHKIEFQLFTAIKLATIPDKNTPDTCFKAKSRITSPSPTCLRDYTNSVFRAFLSGRQRIGWRYRDLLPRCCRSYCNHLIDLKPSSN
jgi:hypothetical protein